MKRPIILIFVSPVCKQNRWSICWNTFVDRLQACSTQQYEENILGDQTWISKSVETRHCQIQYLLYIYFSNKDSFNSMRTQTCLAVKTETDRIYRFHDCYKYRESLVNGFCRMYDFVVYFKPHFFILIAIVEDFDASLRLTFLFFNISVTKSFLI